MKKWGRCWSGLLSVTAAACAWAMLATPETFRTPVYSPVRAVLPLSAWGLLWLGVAVAAVTTAATGWPHPWAVTKVGASSLGLGWLVCLTYGHFIDGHPIAWTGWGLWWWMVASHVVVITSRRQFVPTGSGRHGRA